MVFISVLVLGLTLWASQRLRTRSFGGDVIPLQITILYSWGALLEQPPPGLPVSLSGQVLCHIRIRLMSFTYIDTDWLPCVVLDSCLRKKI